MVALAFSGILSGCYDWALPTDDSGADGDGDGDADQDGDAEIDADEDIDAETDGDSDADLEEDSDIEIIEEPVITGIEGTGPLGEIVPRDEDREAWDEHTGDREEASHRIDTNLERPELTIRGRNLAETEQVVAERIGGSGSLEFDIMESDMDMVRVRFRPTSITAGGLFLLTLTTLAGSAEAQVYFLQGRDCAASILDCDGTTCTLDQNLEVAGDISGVNGDFSGDLDVARAGTFDTLEVNELTVLMSVWLPECPPEYTRMPVSDECPACGDIIVCERGRDQMVKVGDFWVDRYEASVWENEDCSGMQYGPDSNPFPATFPANGSGTYLPEFAPLTPLFACSVRDVIPSRSITWFQAQAACAASGKSLISNAEWQAAVAGTYDPPLPPRVNECNISSGGPRATGGAGDEPGEEGSCISLWGAEDMIGNLYEWTSDWWQAGRGWMATDAEPADVWPDGYSTDNADTTWSLDGRAVGPAGYANGLPAVALRGGRWVDGTLAGAFALDVGDAPSRSYGSLGFRCARGF